eukprot:2523106-Prorocentrum_lima.AAC.1
MTSGLLMSMSRKAVQAFAGLDDRPRVSLMMWQAQMRVLRFHTHPPKGLALLSKSCFAELTLATLLHK